MKQEKVTLFLCNFEDIPIIMIETITTFMTNQIQHLGQWAYMLTFLIALSETVIGLGMITPGSTILLFLGGYAGLTGDLDFFDLVFFAATGAILGEGIKWGITHKISADIDNEREFVLNSLNGVGQIIDRERIQVVDPMSGENFSGDSFATDGKAYVLEF